MSRPHWPSLHLGFITLADSGSRLVDGDFDHYAWKADAVPSTPIVQINVYTQVIYSVEGSSQKRSHPQALWQTPNDELALNEAEAHQHRPQSIDVRLTCQIFFKVLETEHAGSEPLIWVSEAHFHGAHCRALWRSKMNTATVIGLTSTAQSAPIDRHWGSNQVVLYFQRTDGAYGWGTGTQD